MTDPVVGHGKVVSFTYSIVDDTGAVVEQSELPIHYVHGGKHDLFDKVEQALTGAAIGDTIEVSLSPEEGFGPHNPDLTFTDDIGNVPPQYRHVGAEVEMHNDQGDARTFTVTRIEDGKLTVDGNHPMAGKVITFRIRIATIREASEAEIVDGVAPLEKPVLH